MGWRWDRFCLSSGSAELEWEKVKWERVFLKSGPLSRRTMMDGCIDVAVAAALVCGV